MRYKMSKKQIIAEANKIRSELRYTKMDEKQKDFISRFLKKHKRMIKFLIILAITETLIGISLPAISHFYLEKSFALMNYKTFLFVGISLIFLIIAYLINSYYRIYYSQRFTLEFINDIREGWYAHFLKHTAAFNKRFDGKKLMTKLLYHIQLLRMGINNVIFQFFQSALMYIAIIIFAFFFNPQLFIILWISLPVILIIFISMDYIGRYYVTREQTFNSRIVGHLADSLMNFDVLKAQARENDKMNEFTSYIELDTYFRVRRQLWILYTNRVLYGVILLFGVSLYFVQIYLPFIQFDSMRNLASTGLILGYFVRILFSISRVGIFFEAMKLGLRLSVPSFNYSVSNIVQDPPKWTTLTFKSQKTKLSKNGGYIKDFKLEINKKDKILVVADGDYGKTTLAKLLTGQKSIDSMIVKADKRRISCKKWCNYKSNNYYISADNNFDITLGEYMLGKNKSEITEEDITAIYTKLQKYKIFKFCFDYKEFLGHRLNTKNVSTTENVLIQIAHCLLNNKSLIVFDHTTIDRAGKDIVEGIKLLEKEKAYCALILFASENNSIFNYDKVFNLNKASFK